MNMAIEIIIKKVIYHDICLTYGEFLTFVGLTPILLIKNITSIPVEFIAVKQGLRLNRENSQDITSKVIVTIFSLLAELERDLVSERTKIALARAKASGKKLGRPKRPGKSKLDERKKEIQHLLSKGVSKANIAKILGVSWSTLDNFIKKKMA